MRSGFCLSVAALLLVSLTMSACSHPSNKISTTWNQEAAAAYLDRRETWWMGWSASARDHDTFCVSCHTALPYALARPALRSAMNQKEISGIENALIKNVITRTRLWNETAPYYSDAEYGERAAQSRGTEAVLNALILANYDAGSGELSSETRTAFGNMWALQRKAGKQKGSWDWLQFNQEPWEAEDSVYYGACLAAIAVAAAPANYASTPGIQENRAMLRDYLRRESTSQSTLNRIFLLWASTRVPGLLNSQEQQSIVNEVLSRQRFDGGWRLASIAWSWRNWTPKSLLNMWVREDGTPLAGKSDGLATALATLVLQEAGVPRDNIQIQRGLSWLMNNQESEGSWPALSVNKRRHISPETARFMSDAATAFAVLSLTENQNAKHVAKRPVIRFRIYDDDFYRGTSGSYLEESATAILDPGK